MNFYHLYNIFLNFLKRKNFNNLFKQLIKVFPFQIIDDLPRDICEFLGLDEKKFLESINSNNYIKYLKAYQENYDKWIKNSKYYFFDLCKWHMQEKFDFMIKYFFPFSPIRLVNLKILDFGSGLGTRALVYAQKNDVTLVEINQNLLNFSKWRFKKYSLKGEFFEEIPKEKKYDLIMLVDVIGHLTNPYKYIAQIDYSLKKNGILYITFDNFNKSSEFEIHRNKDFDFNKSLFKLGLKEIRPNYFRKY